MGAAGVMGGATGPNAPSIGVQVSVGSSRSQSQSSENQTTQRGSSVTAGGTAAFVATSGDLTVAGSNVSANDVVLAAKNNVNIVNTTNTDSTRSSNSSSSASVGVSVGTNGVGISASMSNAHGDANSDASIQNASHVTGGNSVTIVSGGDTNITGSQVAGNQVTAAVGGNLNIASVQDVTNSAAHQSSAGGGISVSETGGSASFSAQNGHADANYAGVNEQAGIMAGDGGFNVNVKGNTALTGAVISSTADASQNSLTTGTLTYGDIANHSHYDANSNGISAGVGVGNTGKAVGPGSVGGSGGVIPMISQNESGDSSATTRSAVSAGTINVTNQGAQTQDVANLSRDTTSTNGTVANTPDVNNILNQQADTMQAAQAAGQVVAQGIGMYADTKEQQADAAAKSAVQGNDVAAANSALADLDNWKEGGDYRTILQVAGGALIGGLGGGSAFTTIGGAAGAGLSAALAKQNMSAGDAVSSATGSSLLGGLAGNILANLGGAVVGGTAGAAAASNVNLYNQNNNPGEKDIERDEEDLRRQISNMDAAAGLKQSKIIGYDDAGQAETVRTPPPPLAGNATDNAAGSNPTIQFGANDNQTSHTFRHVISGGYDATAIQNAVTGDLNNVGASLPQGQYTGTVVVNGTTFNYSAYKLPNGTINVGRITSPR